MQKTEVFWHLPGFCYFRILNEIVINLMKDYPNHFRDGYRIGSVYGTFPGAIWNGGRAVFGLASKKEMESIIKTYNSKGVPVRFTWTNSLLEECHTYDTYCNLIMNIANNGMNQVLVNQPVLEDYIREHYPMYKMISSTTKRITNMRELKEELLKDYYLVVLDYDLNHNQQILEEIKPFANRIELLVNEVCYPGCKKRSEHYLQQSKMQLEFDAHSLFPCPNNTTKRNFSECMNRPSFISNGQIQKYVEQGFQNFKIVGRGMPLEFVKESYLYFLVKDDCRSYIRSKIDTILIDYKNAQLARKKKM